MPIDINAQIVRMYEPGADPTTTTYDEIHNQQLNEALNAGTVEGILMKTGYIAQYDHNVVIKRDIAGFITLADLNVYMDNKSLNYGTYSIGTTVPDSQPVLQLKHESPISGTQSNGSITPFTTDQIKKDGELAISNYDGSIYLRAHGATKSAPNGGTRVVKVDAGTVNGYVVNMNVTPGNGDDSILTRQEIVALMNSAFNYNASLNKLTISVLS